MGCCQALSAARRGQLRQFTMMETTVERLSRPLLFFVQQDPVYSVPFYYLSRSSVTY